MNYYSDILQKLETEGNRRMLKKSNSNGKYIEFEGKSYLNISSNDYLGIAANSSFQQEFLTQVLKSEHFLFGATSSRLLTGNHTAYQQLEEQLKDLYQKEACLIFNSGYHANIGILPAIAQKDDLILADKQIHASLIDGLKLCNAQWERFRHNDLEHLVRILEKRRNNFRNVFIITESVFSMEGDKADLSSLCKIKNQWNALLYVDEAHAFGVIGKNGLGLCEETGTVHDIDFIVGTFGKAIASQGAFLTCKNEYADYLINKSRSFIFTTALPPITLQWTSFVLNKLKSLNLLRDQLLKNAEFFRNSLVSNGFLCRGNSHIVSVITEKNEQAISLSNHLISNGYLALPIRWPTVAKGEARIRISLNPAITANEIQSLIKLINGWKQNG